MPVHDVLIGSAVTSFYLILVSEGEAITSSAAMLY